jgi:hypothetical protein
VSEYYVPSQDEREAFDELLDELPDHLFTAENVATLAGDFWRRRAAGKTLRVRVPGAGIDWTEVAVPPLDSSEAAAAQQHAVGEENAEQSTEPELPEATLHKLAEGIKDPRMRAILEKAKPMVRGGLEGNLAYGPNGITSIDGRRPTADEKAGYVPQFSMKQMNEMRRAKQVREANVPEGYSGAAGEAPGYAGYGSKAWAEQARTGRTGPTADALAAVKDRLMGRR